LEACVQTAAGKLQKTADITFRSAV